MSVLCRPKPLLILDKLLDSAIVASLLAVTAMMFLQVLLRYVFKLPLMGIEELCYFPTTWLFLLGAVKASSEQSQLVARVFEIFCKKLRTVYLLRIIAAVCTILILSWLTYWAYDYLLYALRKGKLTSSLYLPWIYIEGTVIVAMALMLLYTVRELIDMVILYRATPVGTIVTNELNAIPDDDLPAEAAAMQKEGQ